VIATIHEPRLRVVTLFVVLALGVSVERLETLAALAALGFVWLAAARVSGRLFWRRLRMTLPLVAVLFVFLPWAEGAAGVAKAGMYAGRLLFAVQVLTLMMDRLTPTAFFQTLLRLKLPSIFVSMALFALRYIDVFRLEALGMLKGLRSRGAATGRFFSIRSYVMLSRLIGSLLLRVFRRSERVYLGMLSRGFRGEVPPCDLPAYRAGDALRAAWMAAAATALFAWESLRAFE